MVIADLPHIQPNGGPSIMVCSPREEQAHRWSALRERHREGEVHHLVGVGEEEYREESKRKSPQWGE